MSASADLPLMVVGRVAAAQAAMPTYDPNAGWVTATTIAAVAVLFAMLLIFGVVCIAARCTPSTRALTLDAGDSEVSAPSSQCPADAASPTRLSAPGQTASAARVEPCLAANAVPAPAPPVHGGGSTPPSFNHDDLDATRELQLTGLQPAS